MLPAFVDPPLSSEAPWRSGLRAARANLLPGIVLQVVALALVLGYYFVPRVQESVAGLAALHQRAGVGFAIVSTAIFGGILPFVFLRLAADASGTRYDGAQGLALTLFWAYKGLEVDFWYRLQAFTVGSGHTPAIIVLKVFLDQFVYCPIWAVPLTTLVYAWVESHFAGRTVAADVRLGGWYRRRVLPLLIGNLGVWVPAVAIIYLLPTPLQLPLQNIVLCFYTLVVAHQVRGGS
jgi:hypothetical protein